MYCPVMLSSYSLYFFFCVSMRIKKSWHEKHLKEIDEVPQIYNHSKFMDNSVSNEFKKFQEELSEIYLVKIRKMTYLIACRHS